MDTTNTLREKMFAQYIGQYIKYIKVVGAGFKNARTDEKISAENIDLFAASQRKIILTPLSKIIDKHVSEVAKIFDTDVSYAHRIIASIKRNEPIQTSTPLQMFSVYQYLISKGYDLPQYLLGGKTLFETDMAIYEEEENIKL